MLTYDFTQRGGLSLYEYLYQKIKEDIGRGTLKAHEKLPSKRSLAAHLEISVITVENAYAQLALEGYVYTVEKRGYFVSELVDKMPLQPPVKPVRAEREEIGKTGEREFFLDFQTNSIHTGNFPFSVWSRLMRQVLSQQETGLLQKLPFRGDRKLREAIAGYLYQFRGMEVSPEQILVGAGTEYLYGLLIQLLGRDLVYAVEDPGYQKIGAVYENCGVKCCFIGLDAYGLSVEELRACEADVVHISPAHHFPTGIVMPIKRRQELLRWAAEEKGRYIIEDDYDSEFRFTGRPVQTVQSIDLNQRVIYMNTFSKSIAPSIRISYMVLPEPLMAAYEQKLGFYSCTVPSFEQSALALFISGGYFEQHINRMRNLYRGLRDQVIQAIKQSGLLARAEILEKDAGLHFLLRVDTGLSDSALVQAAAQAGIRISCLSEYARDRKRVEAHVAVVNYSGIDSGRITEGVEKLCRLLE